MLPTCIGKAVNFFQFFSFPGFSIATVLQTQPIQPIQLPEMFSCLLSKSLLVSVSALLSLVVLLIMLCEIACCTCTTV